MGLGKSVRLFLADGTPGGLITAEIMNWTGHVLSAPRSDLRSLLKRPETNRTGIYLLLGDDPNSPGNTRAYIGEGDDVGRRLEAHAREQGGKEFWERAIVLTSKDMNLTKAHARYLESRFIALAQSAGRAVLENSTAPQPIPLPEADRSDMEFFIEQAKIVLPVLGVNLLRSTRELPTAPGSPPESTSAATSPQLELTDNKGSRATAQEVDGEFTVREGSLARPAWTGSPHNYRKLRQRLEDDGTLVPCSEGRAMRFSRDHVFASPSAAAAVVLGRPASGRKSWRVVGSRTTYAEWQESLLDSETP
ncbi:GIY-YIG nuclease family protein [Saccharomonospora sp. NB11]|uniref:GIY-YIG nuclease family protein n=1 Tax=Saccharomonospora sp. NB11 TaxID=1642298 RepID=UPI0018D06E25|nr:GIY-YIG nuclease family protein [Saccharomonospora sp. NB11]